MKKIVFSFLLLSVTIPVFGWVYIKGLEEERYDLQRRKGITEADIERCKRIYALSGEDGYIWRNMIPLSTTMCGDGDFLCKMMVLPLDIVGVPMEAMIGVVEWAYKAEENAKHLKYYEDKLQKIEQEIKKTDEAIVSGKLQNLHEEFREIK